MSEILDMRTASQRWLSQNYYDQWEIAWKHYKCERDPEVDEETGKVDKSATSVSMPDTWSVVRKKAARITANIPNLRVRAADKPRAMRVSWKIMRDWDKGGTQRIQPRHVTQALIFGWSVRPWTWAIEEHQRTKRVDPFDPDPKVQTLIEANYGPFIAQMGLQPPPQDLLQPADEGVIQQQLLEQRNMLLLKQFGKGRKPPLLPVRYSHTAYGGPKSEFLFIGDVFPEPGFQTLRSSKFLIVQRYRDEQWMKRVGERYPKLKKGFQEVIDKDKHGSNRFAEKSNEEYDLRSRLESAVGLSSELESNWSPKGDTRRWLIYECHYPGPNARIVYESESGIKIGEVPYPYELDGRIAFTELVLIDDILGGIGDSDARIIRGLQMIHDRAVNNRVDLVDAIARPLVWTTNQAFYDDPTSLKRGKGLKVLPPVAGPNEIGIIGEQAAIASAAASLRDTQDIERLIQLATGESNLSNVTNQDPQQARTATGARILAYNQDILTKQLNDAFTQSSLREDAEILYLLNRSELEEPITFDAGPYNRNYSSKEDMQGEQTETVSPLDFQNDDDEIMPEVGSTLADDDEANVQKAMHMFDRAMQAPNLFNVEKARDELLIAMGKGRELAEWVPPPAPQEPPMEPPRLSVTVSWHELPLEAQKHILFKGGLVDPAIAQEDPIEGPQPGEQPLPAPPGSPSTPAPADPVSRIPSPIGPALNAALGGQQQR